MTQQIAWGILGCARIVRRASIAGIQGSRYGRLVALSSRDHDKARRWATEFHIPRAYGSYEELLAAPDIQAVYIPLPNELHKPWTLRAAAAGNHVLCDKPLGLNAAEAEEMVAACRRAGVVLMEGFMWRHHPRTTQMIEMVRRGEIGDLRLIRSSFSFDINRSDWRLDPRRGGGALWDVGCYGVNTARLFAAAEPQAITAAAHWHTSGVDMTLAATLQFSSGVLAQTDCSFEIPFRCHFELVGTTGVLEAPGGYLPDDSSVILLHRGDSVQTIPVPAENQYSAMIDHFCAAVVAGRPLDPPAEDGLANMHVLDAVLASARGSQGSAPPT